MNRNLFIGLGGCGIRTVNEIKQQFINVGIEKSSIAVVFRAIDTDIYSLHNCTFLSPNELVDIGVSHAYARYLTNQDKYDIPQNNAKYLKGLRNYGSNQVRSNGRFCFLCNEEILRGMILHAYHELTNIELSVESANIDVHLFFSLCGGTGSGIFNGIAKLVKEIIPNSNITCYAYSHNYFMNIINRDIKLNTYAALLETNYCFNIAFCQNSNYNLFDKFIYIDNQYFSDGFSSRIVLHPETEVLYNETIPNVAKCLTMSVKYDISIGDKSRYNKWISSVGFTELPANDLCGEIDEKWYRIQLALRKASPFMDTKDWQESLRFNKFHVPSTYVITHDTDEVVVKLFRGSYLGESMNFVHPSWSERNKIVIIRSLSATELLHVVGIDELEKLFKDYINGKVYCYSLFTTKEFDLKLGKS